MAAGSWSVAAGSHAARPAPRTARRWVLLALAAAALSVSTTAASLAWLERGAPWWTDLQASAVCVAMAAAGAVIVRSGSGRDVGRLLIACAVAYSASEALGAYAAAALPRGWPVDVAALWVSNVLWPLFVVPLVTLLPLLLPDGRPLSRRWLPWVWMSLGAVGLLVLTSATAPALTVGPPPVPPMPNPAHVPGLTALASGAGAACWAAGASAGAVSLVLRWRRGDARTRQQLVLITLAFVVVVAFLLVQSLLPAAVARVGLAAWPLLVLAAITTAVVRHQLWDVRIVVRRAAVYGCIVAALLAAYAVILWLLNDVLTDAAPAVAALLAAAVTAVCFEPSRRWAQRSVARRLFGDRDYPLTALTRLQRQIEQARAPDELLHAVASTVAEAVRSPAVTVAVRGADGLAQVASFGPHPDEEAISVPLVHRSEDVGALLVAPRAPGEPWSRADRELLDQLSQRVAASVVHVRQDAEIAELRRQALHAAADERARLGRDLHDGLGPLLAGSRLAARGLELTLGPDSPYRAQASQLVGALQDAAGEVRRIIDGLAPSTLDTVGLVDAVRGHLASLDHPDAPRFTLHADEGDLAPAVSEAAHRIVLEAVTNVLRHAHARHCTVRLGLGPAALTVEVVDDGRGLGTYVAGVGVRSMRRRALSLGGSLSLAAGPEGHGTHVLASLPLRSERAA